MVRNKIVSALRWAAIGNFVAQAFTWCISIYVIRLLEPEDYAVMAIALVMTGLAVMLREAGLGDSLIHKQGATDNLLKQVFGLVLILNLFFYTAIYLVSPLVSDLFSEPRLEPVLQTLCLVLLIGMFAALPDALLRRDMNFKRLAQARVLGAFIGSSTTLALAYQGFGVWSLVYGNIVNTTVSSLTLYLARPVSLIPDFRFRGIRSVLSFGGMVTAERIMWYLYTRSDVFIVGRILGNVSLGYYAVAQNIALMPMSNIASIVNRVAFPAYSEIQHDKAQLTDGFLKAAQICALGFFPAMWGISLIAVDLIPLALSETWGPSALLLQLTCLSIPVRGLATMLSPVLLGLGKPEIALRNVVTNFVIVPTAILIGTQWGTVGVCVAWLLASTFAFSINLKRSLPIVGIPVRAYLASILPTVLIALTMYGVVFGFQVIIGAEDRLLRLILSILLGALVFGGLSLLFNRTVVMRALRMLKRK